VKKQQSKEMTMRDIMGMMGKVKEMQSKMEKTQAEIAALEIEGKSGGGLVTIVLNGKGEMKSIKIDPSLFKEEDSEILEDLIVAAHKDAKDKGEVQAQEKMASITAGIPLPPGMKFPF
jgi:hypothetical protein